MQKVNNRLCKIPTAASEYTVNSDYAESAPSRAIAAPGQTTLRRLTRDVRESGPGDAGMFHAGPCSTFRCPDNGPNEMRPLEKSGDKKDRLRKLGRSEQPITREAIIAGRADDSL